MLTNIEDRHMKALFKFIVKAQKDCVYTLIQDYDTFCKMFDTYEYIDKRYRDQAERVATEYAEGGTGYGWISWGLALRDNMWEGVPGKEHGWLALLTFQEFGAYLALAMVSRTIGGMRRTLLPVKSAINRVVNTCGRVYAHADANDCQAVAFAMRIGMRRYPQFDYQLDDGTKLLAYIKERD